MITFLSFAMIIVFMYLIMSKKLSALNALILVPVVFALLGGFTNLGPMMLKGIESVASTGIMLVFAILYFGVLIDAGMFDPLVNKVVQLVKGDPVKITIGTAALSLLVGLDGDGTITYMIVVTALLPIYKRLGMNPLILACLPALSMGIMNILPWGGPTARVLSVLKLDTSELLVPIIPAMIAGVLWIFAVALFLGKRERSRLGITKDHSLAIQELAISTADHQQDQSLKRPKLFWFNLLFTFFLVAALLTNLLPIPVLFMLGFSIILVANYPRLEDQKERLQAHAGNILTVVPLVFAAGIFTGILEGTKMVDAMAGALVSIIPDFMGPQLPLITSITSMPFTFIMANDPYYFGIIPILAKTASQFGIEPIEIGMASLLGQPLHLLSPLVGSVYVLIGLAGIEFRDHIRFTAKYAVGTALVMTIAGILSGALSIF
ncbi:citrate-Mg2+:H+ or citrate-Ca2+:H+ symporter, CitMHS family [Fictibacillus solisalsi]|uniref:Citrate-Mg2+:H+ or citrate-Ca2+:H+ symporter, CitMHS family n=1 Tax=Fictibacillus solisalsi TaxID=459525 RepID=A0A1G9YEN4_9BACL|nr:CitMHS family transporter [Fictibacillus solisalsi]SDN06911.1 citrate-Mg2+:H+ or citrate-Ca2+:H+ symporter, CitMHS family [Fictibacillus solisalsi]